MGRRERFLKAWRPLQSAPATALEQSLTKLFPSDDEFARWEDSIWLGLFFGHRMTELLAKEKRVEPGSPAARIQNFLEVATGGGAFFSPQILLRDMPDAIRRTCCVRIGDVAKGSGFLIGPDVVLTNWHVVHSVLEDPTRISIYFDYYYEAGVGEPPVRFHVRAVDKWRPARRKFLPVAPRSDTPLDYAVLRLATSIPAGRGFVGIAATPDLSTGSRVVVIGHPEGKPLAVSFSRTVGLHDLDESIAHYDADTLSGSSGSLALLETHGQLKAALLHAGGLADRKNFGICLRAISRDLAELAVDNTAPPAKSAVMLENFFGSDVQERAGQLATLLTLLPDDVDIDRDAPLSDQIEGLQKQWKETFQEALSLARAVAVPASANEPQLWEVKRTDLDAEPKPLTPPAEDEREEENAQENAKEDPRKEEANEERKRAKPSIHVYFIGFLVIFGAIGIWLLPKDRPIHARESTCGLTEASYWSPQEAEFKCDGVATQTRVMCRLLTSQGGVITGSCHHKRPVGLWTSSAGNRLNWSADFDSGVWHVPYTHPTGVTVTAAEERQGTELVSRSYTLPSKTVVVQKARRIHMRCGGASLEFESDTVYDMFDGTSRLQSNGTEVIYDGKRLASELINEQESRHRLKQFTSALEVCSSIKVAPPSCKVGTWETGCKQTTKDCYQHIDKSIDEMPCGSGGRSEKAARLPYIGRDADSKHSGCTTFTPCAVVLRPIPAPSPFAKGLKFPIGKCTDATFSDPIPFADRLRVEATCSCADGSKTRTEEVASYHPSKPPTAAVLTRKLQALSETCAR